MSELSHGEQALVDWCRSFMEFVPQEAAYDDDGVAVMRQGCVKVLGTPAGDDWRLTPDEAAAVVAGSRTWPEGRVGTDDEAYGTPQLRAACQAWLQVYADEPLDDAPRLQATRSACEKIAQAGADGPADLTWMEARAIRLLVRDSEDWQWVERNHDVIMAEIRPRTSLGRAWDRLRGRG